ncbi:MAG: T9SS type A sorting domain-containing protein [Ignavibacteria bacterium]|nr:T9SS type A sorting domain-containing protein [Ignavibacteria bacterium]
MKGLDVCGNPMINPINGQPTRFRYDGNACTRTGWCDSFSNDVRDWSNSGPFVMNSGDTQIVVMSFMVTRDGGNNFQNVCALQSLSDSALKYYYNDFRLCVPIGIQLVSTEIPQQFELFQNYPNPFNPATKIRFDIPVGNGRDHSVLKIYDAIGREISALVNEELNPGTYEVSWDASNYPSGVYFYRLRSGNFTQTKKMVVIK